MLAYSLSATKENSDDFSGSWFRKSNAERDLKYWARALPSLWLIISVTEACKRVKLLMFLRTSGLIFLRELGWAWVIENLFWWELRTGEKYALKISSSCPILCLLLEEVVLLLALLPISWLCKFGCSAFFSWKRKNKMYELTMSPLRRVR